MAKSNKIGVFIDGGYLEKVLKYSHNQQKVDLVALVRLMGESSVMIANYYDCDPYQSSPPTEKEKKRFSLKQKLFNDISRSGTIIVKRGKLLYKGRDGNGKNLFFQKRVDCQICADIVRHSILREIDKVLLLSGDSDLIPAVEMAKEFNVVTELWHGDFYNDRTAPSKELLNICAFRRYISPTIVKQIATIV